jgi:DNA-binding XRE family transcriptional regulator
MDKQRFAKIRAYLGKTQKQMAQLMGISTKAISSLEQGWRNITPHIERQIYFLLSRKTIMEGKISADCWEVRQCPEDKRQKCPAWEFSCGQLCWFINGTICNGETQVNWQKKMNMCKQCEVFQKIIPPDLETLLEAK